MAKHSPAFVKLVDEARARVSELTVDDVKKKIDSGASFHLIDVREGHEFAEGHIPSAKHLSKGVIERDIEEAIADSEAEIVLYCGGGYRSALAAVNVQQMGYTNVHSMDGGWRAWTEAGLPAEKP